MLMDKSIKNRLRILTLIIIILLSVSSFCFSTSYKALAKEDEVHLGGLPIGLNITSDGLVVIDFKPIITTSGAVCPAKESGIEKGDLILSANKNAIRTANDLQNAINNANSESIPLTVFREDKELELIVNLVFDPLAGMKKIGLIVKNDISGVGTITYIDNTGNYCSLGHKICDSNLDNQSFYQKGNIYNATILGVYKGNDNEAGALKGAFDKNSTSIGNTSKNCDFGVYGKITDDSFYKSRELVKLGSKSDVKPGKAYIYTTIEGSTPQKYQIEIVKNYNQDKPEIKSMVIRVTDKRLLEKAGGIVQGMSGSPIVQNDKLVGAVTHVFLKDSSIGYGVYIDWLF